MGSQSNEFLISYLNKGKVINNKINNVIKSVETELKSKTKGSLFQYLHYFPNDSYLNFWAGLISLSDKNVLKNKYSSIPKLTSVCFYRALTKDKKNQEFISFTKK